MGVPQSLAAVLALFALVLAVEGVTRGSPKQLFAGLLLAIAATLTFSFGDALSTLNIQMVDQLPRWSDVPHPLPEPAPPPAPPKTEATPPTKTQTTASNDTSANLEVFVINFHPTVSPNGLPRFLAVYPREKFMDKTDWKTPPLNALNAMYDALTTHEWEKADAYAEAALSQLKVADIENKDYYQFHITWAQGIAKMEMGNFGQAILYFNDASKMSAYGNSGADDAMRFQIDIEIAYLFADAPNARYMRDFLPDLESASQIHLQEISLLHYARALRAAKQHDNAAAMSELQLAKNFIPAIFRQVADASPANRLHIIFNNPFGAPEQTAVSAPVAVQTAPAPLPDKQDPPIKQVIASPHFYAVYPREVFMSDVNWKNPAVPALVPLYDALEKGDWQGAIALNYDAIRQADILPKKDVRNYRGHILWLWAIAKLESGDPVRASGILSQARDMITYARTNYSDQARMQIDIALFSDFVNVPSLGLPYGLVEKNSPDQAMFHYAEALYYKSSGDNYYVGVHLNEAKAVVDDMDARGLHDQAARFRSVFAAQFPQ